MPPTSVLLTKLPETTQRNVMFLGGARTNTSWSPSWPPTVLRISPLYASLPGLVAAAHVSRQFLIARLHYRGSKLDPRSDRRSTQKTVAILEFRAGLEIETKFISNRRNWWFEFSIRDQQPSLTNRLTLLYRNRVFDQEEESIKENIRGKGKVDGSKTVLLLNQCPFPETPPYSKTRRYQRAGFVSEPVATKQCNSKYRISAAFETIKKNTRAIFNDVLRNMLWRCRACIECGGDNSEQLLYSLLNGDRIPVEIWFAIPSLFIWKVTVLIRNKHRVATPIFQVNGDDITNHMFRDARSQFYETLFAYLLLNYRLVKCVFLLSHSARLSTPGDARSYHQHLSHHSPRVSPTPPDQGCVVSFVFSSADCRDDIPTATPKPMTRPAFDGCPRLFRVCKPRVTTVISSCQPINLLNAVELCWLPRGFIRIEYCLAHYTRGRGGEVVRLLAPPPPMANRVRFPAGSLSDTKPIVGGFSRGSPVSTALAFRRCSIYPSHLAIIGSQELDFGNKIDESEIQNHEISLVQHFYIGTKIKRVPGSELGSFDLGLGKMLMQQGIGVIHAVHTRRTEQEPGETERIAATHKKAARHPFHTCCDVNCTTTFKRPTCELADD
ncbi:hypothetical protein PR048_030375 [Dryococelus australis]|uniref:Uncharacterized protein n=1 Tax=Dryococelus australis TaxID=614101 RepID=A0ABQ9G8T3_9NEOP|nr:hypothetical protein PR048_030375 [Dryococelus australis]